ncbi:hypothetical protein RB595_003783 [Gaeumannomyces hyphopodioides]
MLDLEAIRKAVEDSLNTNVTKTVHSAAYPAISPLRQELSQAGKTVLITGGGTSVGLAMGKAFVAAKAARVVIVGRRDDVLASTRETLQQEAVGLSSPTVVVTKRCDVTAEDDVDGLWSDPDVGLVHVLILNAARFQTIPESITKLGYKEIWISYEANVKGPLHFAQKFSEQVSPNGKPFPKVLINVSTSAINMFEKTGNAFTSSLPSYGLTKSAGTMALQVVAGDSDPDEMRVVSFHPGVLHSQVWRDDFGMGPEDLPFDNFGLPGSFAVWLASPEARFLHGRFVWASWDVEKLAAGEVGRRLEEDYDFLRVGVIGGIKGNKLAI